MSSNDAIVIAFFTLPLSKKEIWFTKHVEDLVYHFDGSFETWQSCVYKDWVTKIFGKGPFFLSKVEASLEACKLAETIETEYGVAQIELHHLPETSEMKQFLDRGREQHILTTLFNKFSKEEKLGFFNQIGQLETDNDGQYVLYTDIWENDSDRNCLDGEEHK